MKVLIVTLGRNSSFLSSIQNLIKKSLSRPFVALPRLEPHVYSDSEYQKMKNTINKMTKNGIVLFQTGKKVKQCFGRTKRSW